MNDLVIATKQFRLLAMIFPGLVRREDDPGAEGYAGPIEDAAASVGSASLRVSQRDYEKFTGGEAASLQLITKSPHHTYSIHGSAG